jgi:hypothetical protein
MRRGSEGDVVMIAWHFVSNRPASLVVTGTLVAGVLFVAGTANSAGSQALFQSQRITPKEYTKRIEGPVSDAAGTLYVVNFERDGTIGKLPLGATHSEPRQWHPLRSRRANVRG